MELESVVGLGEWVLIERNEAVYPSKGSWPKYKDRVGRVVSINKADAEYAITFDKTYRRDDGTYSYNRYSWFRLHEFTSLEAD